MDLRIIKLCFFSIAAMGLLISVQAFSSTSTHLKTTEVDLFNKDANRPTKILFWYQTSGETCEAKMCLSKEQDPNKLAIISHGTFGSPREMNWLGYALASQGWVFAI